MEKICEQHLDSPKVQSTPMENPSDHWTSATFYSVAMATKEKPSFATENNMSLSKIPFNFKQLQ